MNNTYFITIMMAFIMILLIVLFSMVITLILTNQMRPKYQRETDLEKHPALLPTRYPTWTPKDSRKVFPAHKFGNNYVRGSPANLPQKNLSGKKCPWNLEKVENKRDRRSLESFCWIPTGVQSIETNSTAYYNKCADFNSLHRSKASIFLV